MARFTALFFALATVLSATSATPVPEQGLEKRARTGQGTWYNTGLGACGWTNKDSDKVVALPTAVYGSGSHCGKTVHIKNTKNGKTATATVADECPGCGNGGLDMTPGLFKTLGNLDDGVIPISWDFN